MKDESLKNQEDSKASESGEGIKKETESREEAPKSSLKESSGPSQSEARPELRKSPFQARRLDKRRRFLFRKRICKLCTGIVKPVHYLYPDVLRGFVADNGRILPRRITGTCSRCQRHLSREIKRARFLGFLPFTIR